LHFENTFFSSHFSLYALHFHMIDIHTHLYFPQYDADRKEVLRRAFDAGVRAMVSVSTEPADHGKALEIAAADERVFVSLGLHPHYFNEQEIGNEDRLAWDVDELRQLALARRDKVVAIGECGLDYFSHTEVPVTREQKAWQRRGFEAQVALARELGLPVIVHCRDAYEDLLDVLKGTGRPDHSERPCSNGAATEKDGILCSAQDDIRLILHCYMGDTETTKKFLELPNVFFSFTGNVTYPVAKARQGTERDLRETVRLVPADRLLAETDCPFLAPVPHRGRRNEPAFVSLVVEKIAEIKGMRKEELATWTVENAARIFGRSF
jgi:TatD DNase family protein